MYKYLYSTCIIYFLTLCCPSFSLAHTYTVNYEYILEQSEKKHDGKMNALKEALRLATEQAGVYVTSKTRSNKMIIDQDVVRTAAAHMISVEDIQYKWTVDAESGLLTVKVTLTASIEDNNLSEDKLLMITEEHKHIDEILEKADILKSRVDDVKGELNVKRKNQSEKNINLLKEADSKYHFSALLWAYNGDVMSYIGDFDAALFAYTNALSLYSEEIDGAELGKQLQLKRDMLYNNLLEIQEKEVEKMIKNKYSFN